MILKKILLVIFIFYAYYSLAQKTIFTDNFETNTLDSSWQIITGNWRIGDVQEFRIAPAENGYRYMLCSGGKGYISDNKIRLFVNFPDTLKGKTIRLSFSYYILANAPRTMIEGEFYRKEMIDGLRGKPWVSHLLIAKGKWTVFRKNLKIPADANTLRIVFYGLETAGKRDRIVCFDNVVVEQVTK